jgi:hypothetical protein
MNNYQMTPYDQQQMGWMSGMGGAPNPPHGQQFNQGYPPPQARQRFPPKQEIVDYIRGNLFGDEPVTVNLIERDWDRDYIPHFCCLPYFEHRLQKNFIRINIPGWGSYNVDFYAHRGYDQVFGFCNTLTIVDSTIPTRDTASGYSTFM